jgi:hypothetical protein
MNTPETDHQIVMVDLANKGESVSQDLQALINTAIALGKAQELERIINVIDNILEPDMAQKLRSILIDEFKRENGEKQ